MALVFFLSLTLTMHERCRVYSLTYGGRSSTHLGILVSEITILSEIDNDMHLR